MLACLSLTVLFTTFQGTLRAGPSASGPFPIVTVILQAGDTPAGGGGLPVAALNPPITNGNGQVGFSGTLDNTGNDTEFLWYSSGLTWLSTSIVSDVSSIEEGIGLSDNGNYVLSLILNPGTVDSLWTDQGLLLAAGDPAPANPGHFITSLARPTMQSNGTVNWFSAVSDTPGGPTQVEVLYHASDISTPLIAPVLQGGDVVSGFTLNNTGLDANYFVSDNGSHLITFIRAAAPFTQDGFLYLDGSLPLREGDPTGDGDNWSNFDLFQVNNSGNYLVSGDTDGLAASDEFIAYNGLIQVREGDTIGGITLSSSATVQQLSLNNLGQAATIWRILSGQEILFFACDAADLAGATAILATGEQVDTNGDGTADATLTGFNTATASQTFSLAEDGQIYVEADLDYGAGPLEAVISLVLPGCSGNTAPVAAADAYTTTQAAPLTLSAPGVLANDMDNESDPLTAVLIQSPAHGSLNLNSNGGFTYTPDSLFSGSDSFTYRAHDGAALSNLATVIITVTGSNPNSGLQVDPLSLESTQPIDTLVTQTLTLTNTGSLSISWAIGRGPVITYENGPLINDPGGGPDDADASTLQTSSLGMQSLGFGNSLSGENRIADEFTINDPEGWHIDTITFYAYQTESPLTSTMTALNFRIWDGSPNIPTSTILFGDTTTDRLIQTTWSGIYRLTETSANTDRPIMANTALADLYLPPGTYWLDWITDGDLESGPWAPPITIDGVLTTGNALQFNDGNWVRTRDSGTDTHQGFPFSIKATATDCDLPSWLTVDPISSTLAAGTAEQVSVVFNSTGLAAGTYSDDLCLTSSDSSSPFLRLPITITSLAPAIILTTTIGLDPGECAPTTTFYAPGPVDAYYCHTVTNSGNIPLSLHDLEDSQFGPIFSALAADLEPGASFDTVAAELPLPASIITTTVTTATWTAYNPGHQDEIAATDTAAVIIGTPALALTATVGLSPHTCASTSTLSVPIGTHVYYCYRVTNTGEIPLALHHLTDSLGPILTAHPFILAPGAGFNTVAAGITRTVPIIAHTTNTAVWTASNGPLITVTATGSTTITAFTPHPIYMPYILRP